jgi:hypothetical protein
MVSNISSADQFCVQFELPRSNRVIPSAVVVLRLFMIDNIVIINALVVTAISLRAETLPLSLAITCTVHCCRRQWQQQ